MTQILYTPELANRALPLVRRIVEDLVRDLAMPIEFGLETMENFIDWTKNVPFQVERGEGECAV